MSRYYKEITVSPGVYQREHRHNMEVHIGRKLQKGEVVHHIDGNMHNNNIENLTIMTPQDHSRMHVLQNSLKYEITAEDIIGIKEKYLAGKILQAISFDHKLSISTISKIINQKIYKDIDKDGLNERLTDYLKKIKDGEIKIRRNRDIKPEREVVEKLESMEPKVTPGEYNCNIKFDTKSLSEIEYNVLKCSCMGFSAHEIAKELNTSKRTIEDVRKRLVRKRKVKSLYQLIYLAGASRCFIKPAS